MFLQRLLSPFLALLLQACFIKGYKIANQPNFSSTAHRNLPEVFWKSVTGLICCGSHVFFHNHRISNQKDHRAIVLPLRLIYKAFG
jgi:hypothetical protein